MQNPIQTILRYQTFPVFFQKIIFLLLRPLYCTNEKNEVSKKITFECSLTVQIPFQTILGFQIFSKLKKISNFSQYASRGKYVENAKLNTTKNQRKICKIYAKFNAKYARSTFYKNLALNLALILHKFNAFNANLT